MTRHDEPFSIGGNCAAPGCINIVLLGSSRFCARHQSRSSSTVSSNVGTSSTTTNAPRQSRLPEGALVAKRGRSRFGIRSLGRSSAKTQPTTKASGPVRQPSGPEPGASQIRPPSSKQDPSQACGEIAVSTNAFVSRSRNLEPSQSTPLNPDNGIPLAREAPSIRPSQISAEADERRSGPKMLLGDSGTENLEDATLKIIEAKSGKQPCAPSLLRKQPAPVTYMGPENGLISATKEEAPEAEQVQVSAHMQLALSTQKLTDSGDIPMKIKPSPVMGPQQGPIYDSITKPRQMSEAVGDKVDRKPGPPSDKRVHTNLPSKEDAKIPCVSPPEALLPHARSPIQQSNEDLSSRIRSPSAVSVDMNAEDDDEANMADISDSDDEVQPPTHTHKLSFRARCEAHRKKRLANFDSAAFDGFIYRQSDLRPPNGVIVPRRPPRKVAASSEESRFFLPVNPAIHRLHSRSEDWYKKKCQEIKRRPGRKAWFGKVHERRRWLRTMEAKLDKERQQALLAGTTPPFKEPQPRGYKRILDFGDVPEEELPEKVRNNPAWLKACAWHRECTNKALRRQREINRTTEETKSFFMEAFSGRAI
ncbi:hypothetical protein FZEAL_1583 [Fusarium zealandicum]|uniref:Uncharacterized protein n=1 Tax=Fusarium zealandicum TaxID=1053134 RepID=A0A8H4USH5_9HYPO|nr:hypothetical protein FZEAL_1583 [Fusarium zealandicum]